MRRLSLVTIPILILGLASYESSEQAPIPEPATLILVGTGIAGGLIRRRRLRRQSHAA